MPFDDLRTAPPSAASMRGVTRVYGEGGAAVHALRGVDLDVEAGRMTAVIGRSGSGKSTLLQVMAGLDEPTSGTVAIGDRLITGLDDEHLTRFRRTHLGFVFQAFNLLPGLDVVENVRLPFLLAGGRTDAEADRRVHALLDRLGLADRATHRPHELSGGQQQRVAIARALVTRPTVLFADEPTGSLDSDSSAEVLGLLRSAVDDEGQTVVLVTHDPVAASAADRVVRMQDGRIVADERAGSRETVAQEAGR
jgi:putative ABC transport system ATP-binding protein